MNRIISKPINLWQNGWVDRNESKWGERVCAEERKADIFEKQNKKKGKSFAQGDGVSDRGLR